MLVTIRPAGPDDAARIAAIDLLPGVRPWLDLPPEADGDTAAWVRANVEWVERPDHRCVVATQADGAIVGSITLRASETETEGACMGLVVDPAHQNRGVGAALLGWLTTAADAQGLRRVYLAVHKNNNRAITLYARHGWVYDGTLPGNCDRMVRLRAEPGESIHSSSTHSRV